LWDLPAYADCDVVEGDVCEAIADVAGDVFGREYPVPLALSDCGGVGRVQSADGGAIAVADDAVGKRLEALDAAVAELREDRRVVVNRVVLPLKGTAWAIVDVEIESAEHVPDAGRALGRRVDELDATVTELEVWLDWLGAVGAEART